MRKKRVKEKYEKRHWKDMEMKWLCASRRLPWSPEAPTRPPCGVAPGKGDPKGARFPDSRRRKTKKSKKSKRGELPSGKMQLQFRNWTMQALFSFLSLFLHWPVICILCVIRWLTGSDSGLTSGPTSPNSLTSGISSGNEKVRLPHLDRSSCLELTISSFDIAYIVIFLMAHHRRPEFNADLASGSADDHIALSIVHLLSRKLRLMLIVVLQPINYCMAFIFPFPKIAMRHNRCS